MAVPAGYLREEMGAGSGEEEAGRKKRGRGMWKGGGERGNAGGARGRGEGGNRPTAITMAS